VVTMVVIRCSETDREIPPAGWVCRVAVYALWIRSAGHAPTGVETDAKLASLLDHSVGADQFHDAAGVAVDNSEYAAGLVVVGRPLIVKGGSTQGRLPPHGRPLLGVCPCPGMIVIRRRRERDTMETPGAMFRPVVINCFLRYLRTKLRTLAIAEQIDV